MRRLRSWNADAPWPATRSATSVPGIAARGRPDRRGLQCSGDDAGPEATSPVDDTTGAPVASDEPAPTTSEESPDDESSTTEPTPETTAAPEPTAPADPLRVETTSGPVRGGPSAIAGVRNFLAIPFAEPPVGDNAWRPPVPRQPWTEPLDATTSGPSCPQTTEGITTSFVITPDSDPDCLRLSIWSPDDAEGLPVMFWIHGGGFTTARERSLTTSVTNSPTTVWSS